jgi:arginine decarboxylase
MEAVAAAQGEDAGVKALRICLTTGTGEGPTPLAAFDAALMQAGVANYNLLCLSSVIPPVSEIVRRRHVSAPEDYGRRLYVVMSQMREARPGHAAHAGIGWVQEAASGRGLFVELHDAMRSRLEEQLHTTLGAMQRYRDVRYGPVNTEIASATCTEQPVCALVIAVYAAVPW